jgi:hypothetical protein
MMGFENFIRKAITALNVSKIKYVVIGGIAAIFYGRPRTTMDLDIVVLIKNAKIKKLCESLKKNNFEVDEEEIKRAFRERTHVPIFFKNSPYRIDLKGVYSTLDKASLLNRKKVKLLGKSVWIESPEDVIITKLVYGSEQDLNDAKAIILNQKKLNLSYLSKRAKEEKVVKKLKKLMKW